MPLWYERENPRRDPAALQRQAAILEQAADFADEQWCQAASAQDAAGAEVWHGSADAARHCLLGRLDNTVRQENQPPIMEMLLRHRLLEQLDERQYPIERMNPARLVDWNDAPNRTPEEVRQLLRKTAQTLRQEAAKALPPETPAAAGAAQY